MSIASMADERLMHYYENIRQQVEADRPNKYQFATGPASRQYADNLRGEMLKRGISHAAIEWPTT